MNRRGFLAVLGKGAGVLALAPLLAARSEKKEIDPGVGREKIRELAFMDKVYPLREIKIPPYGPMKPGETWWFGEPEFVGKFVVIDDAKFKVAHGDAPGRPLHIGSLRNVRIRSKRDVRHAR